MEENICKNSAVRAWSELHPDILGIIASKLFSLFEFMSFKGVCSSWRYSPNKKTFSIIVSFREPRITDTTQTDYQNFNKDVVPYDNVEFFSINCNKAYVKSSCSVHQSIRYHKMIGSHPHGWVIMLDKHKDPYLIRLFSMMQIQLPNDMLCGRSLTECNDQIIVKAILSCDDPSHLVVIMMYGQLRKSKLAIWRTGDAKWTCLQCNNYIDIAFCDNQPYALKTDNRNLYVESLDFGNTSCLSGKRLETTVPNLTHSPNGYIDDHRLVSSPKGEILIVNCIKRQGNRHIPVSDMIWKVNRSEERCVPVDSLDGNSLIFGGVSSAFIMANDVEDSGYKRNSIYVVRNDNAPCARIASIYNLEDGEIKDIFKSVPEKYRYCPRTQTIQTEPHNFGLIHLVC